MTDAMEQYLLRRLTRAQVDMIPLESFPSQTKRACIAWALGKGDRPDALDSRRTRKRHTGRGRRTRSLDAYLLSVIGDDDLPPGFTRNDR